MTKTPRGKSPMACVATRKPNATSSETTTAATIADRVARAGVAPDAAVEAEGDEREVPRGEETGSATVEDVPLRARAAAAERDQVRGR